MRSPIGLLIRGLAVMALLAPVAVIAASSVAAAPLSAVGACGTGVGNAGGEGVICHLTIVNTITSTGGSAVVTVHECLGSAGNPTDGALGHACTTTTTSLTAPVTSVNQCNGSANGGGATLNCSATITNNFINVSPGSSAVTVDQCVGSGDGLTTGCNPFPATTTGAAITQCNGSANGGNLVGMSCVATGTKASALVVTVNQCNGSGLGGGGKITCSASMANNAVIAATPAPSGTSAPSASSGASASSGTSVLPGTSVLAATSAPSGTLVVAGATSLLATPPPTSTNTEGSSGGSTPLPVFTLLFALAGFGLVAVLTQRRSIRR